MTDENFIKLAIDMRKQQRLWQKTKLIRFLLEAKNLEKKFDEEVLIRERQLTLDLFKD